MNVFLDTQSTEYRLSIASDIDITHEKLVYIFSR